MIPAPQHKHSLRQRLDLISGILLLFMVAGGSASLGLAERQRRDAVFLNALHEQERLVYELTSLGSWIPEQQWEEWALPLHRITEFHDGLSRLEGGLRALRPVVHGRLIEQHVSAALERLANFRQTFNDLIEARAQENSTAFVVFEEQFRRMGYELRIFLRGVAAEAENQSVQAVMLVSQVQLLLMLAGGGLFVGWILLLRRLLTTPLHRMADGISAMQRTGRLVKLPVLHANELGVVASGFNRLAEQIEEQKQRLREHIVELQRVNIELDQLATLKDDFLATINHQLRTPLTAIMEGIALVRDGTLGPLSQDQQAVMQAIDENTVRLDSLVEEVLDLSLLKSDRRPLQRQAGDLPALLRRALASWAAAAKSRALRLVCHELPPVYMNEQAIQEVMDHLLRNAIRHAPESSEILIEATAHDGIVEVSVRNQGPAMSAGQLARLFQPFVHVHTPEAPGSQGSGLGLAFCRQVIERHHGSIRAESSEKQGTALIFQLPLASTRFLFEEACRCAREEAEREHSQFGLILVRPSGALGADPHLAVDTMQRAEETLRQHTHHGDHFVRLEDLLLAIVAVTNQPGLHAMMNRLRDILSHAKLDVTLTSAMSPGKSGSPEALLEAARAGRAREGT